MEREDDVASVSIIEIDHGDSAVDVGEGQRKGDDEILRRSGIEGEIVISKGHHAGTDGAVRFLSLVERDELVIRRQGAYHHLSQLITCIVNQNAKVGRLARIEEAIVVVVVQHDGTAQLQIVVVDRHLETKVGRHLATDRHLNVELDLLVSGHIVGHREGKGILNGKGLVCGKIREVDRIVGNGHFGVIGTQHHADIAHGLIGDIV